MGRSNDAVYKFQHLKILQKKLHLLKMVNQKKAESMGVCAYQNARGQTNQRIFCAIKVQKNKQVVIHLHSIMHISQSYKKDSRDIYKPKQCGVR